MRTTKFAALFAAVALLVVGAAFASFAADPTWVPTGEEWEAYDKDGNQIFSDWATSNGGWYYLGDDGYMVKDALVEDDANTYYVDENGLMVTSAWKKVVDDDYADEELDYPNYRWFYFQANGKAYKSAMKDCPTAAGTQRFAFADDGTMLWGWINKDDYSMSTETEAYASHIYYGNGPEDGHLCKDEWIQWDIDGNEDLRWFYFSASNYKKAFGGDKTIKGVKYSFNKSGIMTTDWSTESTISEFGGKNHSFFTADGQKIVKGWFYTYDPNDPEKDDDEKMYWFYAKNKTDIAQKEVVSDGGKFYVVDEKGHLISGLAQIKWKTDWTIDTINADFPYGIDEDNVESVLAYKFGENAGLYYLNEEHDGTFGCMKSGSQKIGDYTLYFKKANTVKKGMGKAYNGLDGNYFYQNGQRLAGDASENKYWTTSALTVTVEEGKKLSKDDIEVQTGAEGKNIELVEVKEGDENKNQPLFTASGAFVRTLTNGKDSNDLYICVKDYVITYAETDKK